MHFWGKDIAIAIHMYKKNYLRVLHYFKRIIINGLDMLNSEQWLEMC